MALDVSFDDVIATNVKKLEKRYPGGSFDVFYSENRQERSLNSIKNSCLDLEEVLELNQILQEINIPDRDVSVKVQLLNKLPML